MWSKSISSLFFVSSAVLALASADQTFKVDMSSTGTATATALAPGSTSTSQGVIGGTVPVWVIKVGSPNNDEIFSPPQIKANPGDLVQFQFYSNNHSVASAMFDKPCVPELESDPSSKKAFWSGFMPTTDEGKLVFTMKVQDTQPIYFYCSQARHCQSGMVGAINAYVPRSVMNVNVLWLTNPITDRLPATLFQPSPRRPRRHRRTSRQRAATAATAHRRRKARAASQPRRSPPRRRRRRRRYRISTRPQASARAPGRSARSRWQRRCCCRRMLWIAYNSSRSPICIAVLVSGVKLHGEQDRPLRDRRRGRSYPIACKIIPKI